MFLRRRSNSGGPVRALKRNCNQSLSPPFEYRHGMSVLLFWFCKIHTIKYMYYHQRKTDFMSLILKDNRLHQRTLYPKRRHQGKTKAALYSIALAWRVLLLFFSSKFNFILTAPLLRFERPDPWKPAEALRVPGEKGPSVKKRRRSTPGPIIVIKDEPDDDSSYVRTQHKNAQW